MNAVVNHYIKERLKSKIKLIVSLYVVEYDKTIKWYILCVLRKSELCPNSNAIQSHKVVCHFDSSVSPLTQLIVNGYTCGMATQDIVHCTVMCVQLTKPLPMAHTQFIEYVRSSEERQVFAIAIMSNALQSFI